MANSRRVEKFSALIKRELSQILMSDNKFVDFTDLFISITGVEVSGDLQYCKIFISSMSKSDLIENHLVQLNKNKSFFRGEIARRLQMRRAPDIVFKIDRGMKKGSSVLDVLNKLELERKKREDKNYDNDLT